MIKKKNAQVYSCEGRHPPLVVLPAGTRNAPGHAGGPRLPTKPSSLPYLIFPLPSQLFIVKTALESTNKLAIFLQKLHRPLLLCDLSFLMTNRNPSSMALHQKALAGSVYRRLETIKYILFHRPTPLGTTKKNRSRQSYYRVHRQ